MIDLFGLRYRWFMSGVILTLIACFVGGAWQNPPDYDLRVLDLGPFCVYYSDQGGVWGTSKAALGLGLDTPCHSTLTATLTGAH